MLKKHCDFCDVVFATKYEWMKVCYPCYTTNLKERECLLCSDKFRTIYDSHYHCKNCFIGLKCNP